MRKLIFLLIFVFTGTITLMAQTASPTDKTNAFNDYVEQGQKHAEAEDWKKAIKAYEQAVKLNPNDAEVFFNLGVAYYNSKQFSKAITAYQESLRLNPNISDAKEYLADAQAAEKERKEKRSALWNGLVNAASQAMAAVDDDKPTNTGGQSTGQAPRLSKYHVLTYGAATSPPIRLGYFELFSGGKYNFYDNGGNFVGGGNYSFDAGSNSVEWLSGVFKDNGWGGAFTIDREGKTHTIRLKSNTIGTNSTDSN